MNQSTYHDIVQTHQHLVSFLVVFNTFFFFCFTFYLFLFLFQTFLMFFFSFSHSVSFGVCVCAHPIYLSPLMSVINSTNQKINYNILCVAFHIGVVYFICVFFSVQFLVFFFLLQRLILRYA